MIKSLPKHWLSHLNQTQTKRGKRRAAVLTTSPFSFNTHQPGLLAKEEAYRQILLKYRRQWFKNYQKKVWWHKTQKKGRHRFWQLLPMVFLTSGSILLANAVWPILSYFVFVSPNIHQGRFISAIPAVVAQAPSTTTAKETEPLRPKIIQDNLDYTNLSNWFPAAVTEDLKTLQPKAKYVVRIPRLNIEIAEVKIGGIDLDQSLIQYPGTANPGELGAPVIFGHSTLRQFYNPSLKNPRRYLSIFSKIMTLEPGDPIYIDYDGIQYTYNVVKKVEVKPEDTYILEQEYAARQLKLVTCVPEGTYLRRGVVLAQLENKNSNSNPARKLPE